VAVLDLGRKCTIEDVCDFVVQYIESDILGLLADRHLTIAGKGSPSNLHQLSLIASMQINQRSVFPVRCTGCQG
jgi:RNA-dependent RNA polymerase